MAVNKLYTLSKLYLFAYNSLQAIAWLISLLRILRSLASTKSINGTYASVGDLICVLQTSGFMEVIHGAIGIVPSGVLSPLMQWGGRTHFLLAIVSKIKEIQELPSVFIIFMVWSLAELKAAKLDDDRREPWFFVKLYREYVMGDTSPLDGYFKMQTTI